MGDIPSVRSRRGPSGPPDRGRPRGGRVGGRTLLLGLSLTVGATACGGEALELFSRIDERVTLQLSAPREGLKGPCEAPFEQRFCREEFIGIGAVTLEGRARRALALEGDLDRACAGVLWLRLVGLEDSGPVADAGTTFELPAVAEIEYGAGATHTVAFPGVTVRIDEVGRADAHQSDPPPACAELGRPPRGASP